MTRFQPHPDRRPVIVTGASSGIGAACALALAERGYPVALGARRVQLCNEIASRICDQGGQAIGLHLDMADATSIDQFIEDARNAIGEIEILVSNAATVTPGSALSTAAQQFEEQVRVILLGTHRLVAQVGSEMVERNRGDIAFITSDIHRAPRPWLAAYLSAKWGVEGLAQALQMEMEGTGVRTSIIRPGQTATSMGSDWDEAETTRVLESWMHWGLARHSGVLTPRSVAEAVCTAVCAPRGTHYLSMEIQPEAPITDSPIKVSTFPDDLGAS